MKKCVKLYEYAVKELLAEFAKKHDLQFDPKYDADFRSFIFTISDYYVTIETVYIDLFLNAPKEMFFEHYDYAMQGGKINYQSWVMGLRPENLEAHKVQKLAKSKKRVKEAKKTLIESINSDTFSQIKTEMKDKKISISELARRMNRTQQQLSRTLRLENATIKTVENIKKALSYGN